MKAAALHDIFADVVRRHPERIAIDRLKFALALAKFVRHQIDLDATVEQSAPQTGASRPTRQ